MKNKQVFLLAIGLVTLIVAGCTPFSKSAQDFFAGEHELHRMTQNESQSSTISGGAFFLLFLGAGGINGQANSQSVVKFAWKASDGTYIISSIRLERVRIKLQNNTEVRTVQFVLTTQETESCSEGTYYRGPQYFLDNNCISHVVFTVRPSDWPPKLQLPLQ